MAVRIGLASTDRLAVGANSRVVLHLGSRRRAGNLDCIAAGPFGASAKRQERTFALRELMCEVFSSSWGSTTFS